MNGRTLWRTIRFILIGIGIWGLAQGGCQHQPLQPVEQNSPPIVQQVLAIPANVPPGAISILIARVLDTDGDTLQYQWKPEKGTIIGEGALVQWIAPRDTGQACVQVTISDGHGGEVSADFELAVVVPDSLNHPPRILELRADSTVIKGGNRTRIQARVTDPDGDALQFAWLASAGQITGNGAEIFWEAPEERSQFKPQEIALYVTDNRGTVVFRSLLISVKPPYPFPVIENITANPTSMFLGETTTVRVSARSPSGSQLFFKWKASGGKFVQEPTLNDSVVVWQAPAGPVCCAPGPYQIFVTVRNTEGGESEDFVVVQVQLKE